MCSDHRHKLFVLGCRPVVALCLLLLAGCASQRPHSNNSLAHWNITAAQRDSLTQILNENNQFRKQIKTNNLDRIKMKAEIEYRTDRNLFLEKALAEAQKDLARVEKQFVSIENQLETSYTKASSVAVLAEVKLCYDNFLKDESVSPDSFTVWEIGQKLKESERLLQLNNFS
jgi:septal ring factor EnvC (AmiA/AmiB activator)